ncbi:integrase [Pedobacter sp. UYEF25]
MDISINKALWFAIRTDKVSNDGKAPIIMFYSLNGVRVRYATGYKIFPAYWSKKENKAKWLNQAETKKQFLLLEKKNYFAESEITELNNLLSVVSNDVADIEKAFSVNKIPFSPLMVITELKNRKANKVSGLIKIEETTNFLFDFMDKYIADHQATREVGSLTVYKSVKNHLQAYQNATKHKVTFDTIDYNFFNKLQTFLINRTKTDKAGNVSSMLNNTTIAKALSTLKTFLGYAKMQGVKVNPSYKDFSIKKEKLEVIALEQNELDAIINLDLSNNKRLDVCRDIFVFACATGLRHSDTAQLRHEHIKDNVITLTIKKTKTELSVPLNNISASILSKYSKELKPLPTISNQNLNYSIKDLCQLANINAPTEIVRFHGKQKKAVIYPKYELIHFHTARKTFVTLSLEKGMSAEEVMEITGHSDYRSFKRYVKVTEKRKKVVMAKAWGEVNNLKIVSA